MVIVYQRVWVGGVLGMREGVGVWVISGGGGGAPPKWSPTPRVGCGCGPWGVRVRGSGGPGCVGVRARV